MTHTPCPSVYLRGVGGGNNHGACAQAAQQGWAAPEGGVLHLYGAARGGGSTCSIAAKFRQIPGRSSYQLVGLPTKTD